MKTTLNLFLSLLLLTPLGVTAQQQTDIQMADHTCRITFYKADIVRVTKARTPAALAREGMVVIMKPDAGVTVRRRDSGQKTVLSTSKITVTVDRRRGQIAFSDKGKNLLKEQECALELRSTGADKGRYKTRQRFALDKSEPIYGLGTLQNGRFSRRDTHCKVEQTNLEDFQNVIQSIKGWGLYWDNYSPTQYDDDARGLQFASDSGDAIDYYFLYGGSADGVIALIRQLTGGVPMFPLWTFGYWQSKERYKSSREVTGIVDRYRRQQIPLDGIIQDWQYWGSNYLWNAMDFLAEDYADAQQMIDHIHRQHAHLMISIWASFGPHTKQYRELNERNLLYDFATWPQSGVTFWPPRMDYPSGVRVYDAFNPEARDVYWKYLSHLYKMGVDAWWMDSTDPDCFNPQPSDYDHQAGSATWRTLRNAFPLASVAGVSDHQRATDDSKRVFIMTRSSFAGQQRYGSNLWTGDVASSWDMLRKQVPAGLNFTMTGNPNFNTDIGGFFCGAYNTQGRESAPRTPQYQELYVRWMQYGLFCPVFRSHGTDAPREIWQFGQPGDAAYDAIAKTIRLRYQLLPYLYSTAWQVTSNNGSYLRPLLADFAADRRVWDMGNEFLCGQSILALPVLEAQYTPERIDSSLKTADFSGVKTISRYLPKGADWYDFWTGRCYQGGQTITLDTRFDEVPMFIKAGSILPLAPVMQYAGECPWDALTLNVYPGADGAFTLYEDVGDGYQYEQGEYATIRFVWNDRRRVLTLEARQGGYPGMLGKRTFDVKMNGQTRHVTYDGTAQQVCF